MNVTGGSEEKPSSLVWAARTVRNASRRTRQVTSFPMFQAPGQPDEQFETQYHSLLREFENLELPFG
jgi:hypothetical protein